MRNLKKFLALVLAFMMAMSLMVTVNAASYADQDKVTYTEAVDTLNAFGVLKGYSDGTFKPGEPITRAEVAAVVYRIVTGDTSGKNATLYEDADYFTDVAEGKWYNGYVNFCANNGLVKGVGGDRFAPSNNVTGYEALVMILRAMGYNNPAEFSSGDWKLKASGYGRTLGITSNIGEGKLSGPATREMVAEIMFQAMQKPIVNYNALTNRYSEDVLVARYQSGGDWVYDHDVYNTLMYKTWGIVGKRTIVTTDGTYGRPVQEWVTDAADDSVANGGKYIVNPQSAKAVSADAANGVKGGSAIAAAGDVYIPVATSGATYTGKDVKKFSVSLSPVYSFRTAMTECDLSKEINNDSTIAWSDIDEYVNGNLVKPRSGDFDATHTTNTDTTGKSDHTIGAQGRVTEIYQFSQPEVNDAGDKLTGKAAEKWSFVYIDVLLGEVVKVVPLKLDTNDHVMADAELYIAVNGTVKNANTNPATDYDNCVKATSDEKSFTQKVGDMVLLTTWGLSDETQVDGNTTGNAIQINEKILASVPSALDDFKRSTYNADGTLKAKNGAWGVDLASDTVGENETVPTVTITVKGTTGPAKDKTGVADANGKVYPTTWAYHVDNNKLDDNTGTAVTDDVHADTGNVADMRKDTVLKKFHTEVLNSIIGQTFTAALDKEGNIAGMWPGSASKMVGVLTDADYARVGLGKYAVEFEIYTTEGKTETVRMLNTDPAKDGIEYFPSQDDADTEIKGDNPAPTDAIGDNTKVGNLVMLESYTKDGATYWKVIDDDADGAGTAATASGGLDGTDTVVDLFPGLGNGLTTATRNLNDESVVIVVEYEFDYSAGTNNEGKNINKTYSVYKGFRSLPYITTDTAGNILWQQLEDHEEYLLVYADDPADGYTFNKKSTIAVDDSFLVVAHGTTYAEYSEFTVVKNGKLDTIKVANVNDNAGQGLNETLQAGIRTKGLFRSTGENSKGYITAVKELTSANFPNDANLGKLNSTFIAAATAVTYDKGVLTIAGTPDYLTVAENCQVKIVNVDKVAVYDATLDSLTQYADQALVFELDANGWVSYLYIID